ncbi:MbeB family mobilization protein [Shewanella sp. S1-58-MNA-CIBAN-0166]|uniref:MbeB family mobilization protein n=1 Tax=Shewanella sp. S1-58-MNA-CIBAN-0166 TaxID=3140467 RepID=UPI00333332D0
MWVLRSPEKPRIQYQLLIQMAAKTYGSKGLSMNEILNLTKKLELQSNEQLKLTKQRLSNEFNEHTKSLQKELKDSQGIISADIHALTQELRSQASTMRLTALSTWAYLLLSIIIVLVSIQGVLWYQGNQISANLAMIQEQEQTLKALQNQTFGVKLVEQSGKQYILFPKNRKLSQQWESNGQNVVEMENR